MRRSLALLAAVTGFVCLMTPDARADMVTIDFGTEASEQMSQYELYIEDGMQAFQVGAEVSDSGPAAWIGDPLGQSSGMRSDGNGFYFRGSDAYVEIRSVEGSPFDLLNLSLLTDDGKGRWFEASSGAKITLPSSSTSWMTWTFGMPTFSGITWLRVGTPSGATQIDNIRVSVVPLPAAMLLGVLGFGVAGVKLRKFV